MLVIALLLGALMVAGAWRSPRLASIIHSRQQQVALGMCGTPPAAAGELSLKLRLSADMKAAMKAKEKERLAAIRAIQTAIKQVEVDERKEVDDAEALTIMAKLVKMRRESITSYEAAGRADLALTEQSELSYISQYMPEQLSADKIDVLVKEAIAKVGATTVKDMGRVMNELRGPLAGRADMSAVGNSIKKLLG